MILVAATALPWPAGCGSDGGGDPDSITDAPDQQDTSTDWWEIPDCIDVLDVPSDPAGDDDAVEVGDPDMDVDGLDGAEGPGAGWPVANEWSWNGSWAPSAGDLPPAGLFDDEYFDGHADSGGDPTPVLPPGEWDWDDASDDLANWRNFDTNLGHFAALLDGSCMQYGWRLIPNDADACDYSGPAMYFEGSSGADVMDLGDEGSVHSFGSGNLAEGPDVLVFRYSYSLDFRTGSSLSGGQRDDDLVVAGCSANADGAFDMMTSTIHTGPGADWAFVRNISRAAVDLGNGDSGRTDALDPLDGDDLLVLGGNTHDFRVMGGAGDDVAVWFVDENVQTTTWLGPNFFGGGAWGEALWGDTGTDRLVLAVPDSTPVVTSTPTPAGSVMVRAAGSDFIQDDPTAADPYARYCIECGTGPDGRRTVIVEYNSADGTIETGYFFVTAFEELQIGVGPAARVLSIDDATGAVEEMPSASIFVPPSWPDWYCS